MPEIEVQGDSAIRQDRKHSHPGRTIELRAPNSPIIDTQSTTGKAYSISYPEQIVVFSDDANARCFFGKVLSPASLFKALALQLLNFLDTLFLGDEFNLTFLGIARKKKTWLAIQ
jgi:hypothetical protein